VSDASAAKTKVLGVSSDHHATIAAMADGVFELLAQEWERDLRNWGWNRWIIEWEADLAFNV